MLAKLLVVDLLPFVFVANQHEYHQTESSMFAVGIVAAKLILKFGPDTESVYHNTKQIFRFHGNFTTFMMDGKLFNLQRRGERKSLILVDGNFDLLVSELEVIAAPSPRPILVKLVGSCWAWTAARCKLPIATSSCDEACCCGSCQCMDERHFRCA